MENLVCSQCGGNLFNKLPDGNYQCLYCNSIMMPGDETTKILTDTAPETVNTNEYEDPELAELCSMELDEIREQLSLESNDNEKTKLLLAIKELEKELNEMKLK